MNYKIPQKVEDYNSNGYVIVKNILDKDTINDLIKIIQFPFQKLFNYHFKGLEKFDIYSSNHHNRLINIDRQIHTNACLASRNALIISGLLSNKSILGMVNQLTRSHLLSMASIPVLSFHNKVIASSNLYWQIPPHIDYSSMQGSENGIIAWIPLVDITTDLGPLNVLPGSHKMKFDFSKIKIKDGFSIGSEQFNVPNAKYEYILAKKGDIIFFNPTLIHKSGVNISNNVRVSIQLRYNDLGDKGFIERSYPFPYSFRHVDKWL